MTFAFSFSISLLHSREVDRVGLIFEPPLYCMASIYNFFSFFFNFLFEDICYKVCASSTRSLTFCNVGMGFMDLLEVNPMMILNATHF